jgi:hypothetical protein
VNDGDGPALADSEDVICDSSIMFGDPSANVAINWSAWPGDVDAGNVLTRAHVPQACREAAAKTREEQYCALVLPAP